MSWKNTSRTRLVRPMSSAVAKLDVLLIDLDWFRLNVTRNADCTHVKISQEFNNASRHVSSYGFICVVFMCVFSFCWRCVLTLFWCFIGQVSGESTSQQFRRTMSTLVRQTSKSSSLSWEEVKGTQLFRSRLLSDSVAGSGRCGKIWDAVAIFCALFCWILGEVQWTCSFFCYWTHEFSPPIHWNVHWSIPKRQPSILHTINIYCTCKYV